MIKQKKTLRLILFAHLLCVGQVRTQSLTDYLFRPASTIFNSLTGGFTTTAQPGQISNRDGIVTQAPGNSQSQNFVRQPQSQRQQFVQPQQQQYVQPSQGFSPNQQFVNSYQPAQSCANSMAYQRDNNGNTQGYLSIRNPSRSRNILKVTLIVAAQLSTYYGAINLAKDKDSTANDINNGQPLSFRIDFPTQNPLPKLISATLNDQQLCSSPKDGGFQTTLMLEFTFTTSYADVFNGQRPSLEQFSSQYTQQVQQVVQPVVQPQYVQQTTRVTQRYTQPPVQPTQAPAQNFNFDTYQCGVPDYNAPSATGLVFGGRFANRGQFPWLAAFYHTGKSETVFICGGSLVSTKVIVTAAHCIQNKDDHTVKRPEDSQFYLGKHSLETLHEQYFTTSGVSQFVVHPDWRYSDKRYDADIAIAILVRTVSFNKFVKPICMWSGSSYEDLVGRRGTIVGWGKTEYSAVASDKPKWAEITVVSAATCLRSNSAFNKLTSDRTFCAGERDGRTGPCNGDSGGGFAAQSNNKWYLRGVVSASLLAEGVCDTQNYAVFTDVTKFNSWIRNYIQSYG